MMTPKQVEIWQGIVKQCGSDGEFRTGSVNVGTQNRRDTIIAANRDLTATGALREMLGKVETWLSSGESSAGERYALRDEIRRALSAQ